MLAFRKLPPLVSKALQSVRSLGTGTDFKRVGIVGLGLMGHGVAQVTAQAGYQVVAIETSKEALEVNLSTYFATTDSY